MKNFSKNSKKKHRVIKNRNLFYNFFFYYYLKKINIYIFFTNYIFKIS